MFWRGDDNDALSLESARNRSRSRSDCSAEECSMIFLIMVGTLIVVVIVLVLFVAGLRIADQYQRAVVLRLGRFQAIRGPGLYWIIPALEWQLTVDIRTVTAAVEQQETITKD